MELKNIRTFLALFWSLSQIGQAMAASIALSNEKCLALSESIHQPSNKALRMQLEEEREQGKEADLMTYADLYLTVDTDITVNDCPADELARQNHKAVRGRATCPYKEVHLKVDQSHVGAVRIFPSEIKTAVSCSSVPGSTFPPKECRVTPVHEGECSDVPHRKRILRATGGCRWSEEDSKYYWTYELKSVKVNKMVLCARPEPYLPPSTT